MKLAGKPCCLRWTRRWRATRKGRLPSRAIAPPVRRAG